MIFETKDLIWVMRFQSTYNMYQALFYPQKEGRGH